MTEDEPLKPHPEIEIEDRSDRLRSILGLTATERFNVIHVIENVLPTVLNGFFLEILSEKEMNGVEAYTDYDPLRISIREDIYGEALNGDGRSRFTVAHELGHLCLHWGHPRPRLEIEKQWVGRSKYNQRLENEANRFASALLMPLEVAKRIRIPHQLAAICQVSKRAAECRLNEVLIHREDPDKSAVLTVFGRDQQDT